MNIIKLYPFLFWHSVFVFPVSVLLWVTHYKCFLKYKKIFIWMTILSPIWGFFFDTDAVTSGLWFFNQHFSLGIEILGLPVEEWIFLFVVPQELTAILLIIKQYVGDNKR